MHDTRNPLLALLRHRNAKKYCAYTAGVGISAYLAYSLYKKDSYWSHLKRSLGKYTSAVDKGGDVLQKLLTDLYEYVVESEGAEAVGDGVGEEGLPSRQSRGSTQGDEHGQATTSARPPREVPESLRKVARLVESKEFRVATRSTVRAMVEGLVSVDDADDVDGDIRPRSSALDKVLEALVSERGSSLVSVALSMAAKNVVNTYLDSRSRTGPRLDEQLFAFLSNPRGQELAIRCISACADSAMLAYTQETRDVNYYDMMLDAIVKNKDHSNLVMDCISLSIRAAVSAWNASEEDLEAATVDDLAAELPDIGVGAKGHPYGAPMPSAADLDSPISALRPPLSSIATPTSSTGRVSQASLTLRRRRNAANNSPWKAPRNEGFLRALSKEFIAVSKDEHGREAIAKVVGSVTKEAVGAVASTVADRLDAAYFLSVLLLGVLMSVVVNLLLRLFFSS